MRRWASSGLSTERWTLDAGDHDMFVEGNTILSASDVGYFFRNLPPFTMAAAGISAEGVNNAETIVGFFGAHGFIYKKADYKTFDFNKSATLTLIYEINDYGEFVGTYDDAGGRHAFLSDSKTRTTLDPPERNRYAEGYDVNNSGEVVGAMLTSAREFIAFLYSNGVYTTLRDPDADGQTWASGINDASDIVGWYEAGGTVHGFLYRTGIFTTIDVPGAGYTTLEGINNKGDIVGTYDRHAFLYSGGVFKTIDSPLAPSGAFTRVRSISEQGQIVGFYDKVGLERESFVATPTQTSSTVSWTVRFDDEGQYSAYHSAIARTLLAAGNAWSSFLGGSGTIDVIIRFANAGTQYHAFSATDWHPGSVETTDVAYEVAHGADPDRASADLTLTINADYLVPGTGSFWFDPDSPAPAGQRDAFSTFEHEIGHALGISGFRDWITGEEPSDGIKSSFDQHITKVGSTFYFNGPNAVLLNEGRPVELESTHAKSMVYHIARRTDLMFYTRQNGPVGRTGISALDLSILNDTGIAIANGTVDADVLSCVAGQLSINGSGGNDMLSGNELDNEVTGGDGNDKLKGLVGKDTLNGGEGDDYIFGGANEPKIQWSPRRSA